MSKPSNASQPLAVQPVYLAAKAINSVLHALPAGTAYFIGIVLITMFTGQLVHHQGSLARAALPYVLQLRWGWHRVERAMERGKVRLDVLFDQAFTWCCTSLPVEPVRLGRERRTVHALDTSTVVRLRAKKQQCALLGKGYCQRAQRAVQANLVAALTSVVLIRGIRVGVVRRTRFGATCQEAVAQLFADLPTSPEKRLFSVDAGIATIEQFQAATEHDALVGRLRKNVTLRRAPAPKRPGKRGRPALHGPVLHPGAKRPEGRPDGDMTVRLEDREVRVRRWRNLHFRETPRTPIDVVRVDDPAYKRPLLIGTTARELTTDEIRSAYAHRWPIETNFYVAQGTCAMEMPRAWSETGVERRISLALLDWVQGAECTHIALESTGSYWRPVYNLLEGQFTVLVGNAYHMKTVPGRKTDVKDAEWIADLLRHGLIRGSFIPTPTQRQLRDLTRYRTHLVEERARLINRLQVVLEDANVKLASVVTDIRGTSARAMLAALVAGETDPTVLADFAQGRMRAKREMIAQAVVGRFTPHHAFLLTEHLGQLDYLEDAIARVSAEITQRLAAEQEALALLDTIPGVGQRAAEILLAEVGTDLSRFPSAKHLASWAGVCPGNTESGGKRLSGKTRKGNSWLRHVLFEVAHAASKTKATYLSAQYRRLATRRGKQRALIAIGHSILVMAYHILTRRVPYRELGPLYFDNLDRQRVQQRLVHRLGRLGYVVDLHPTAA